MPYGSASGVAAFARTWTDNGSFLDPSVSINGTNPTLAQVEEWLDQVSIMVDLALGSDGFDVPVTQEYAVKALDAIVNALVSDLCHAANSAGRFFTDRALEGGRNPMMMIRSDINTWVTANTNGLIAMGVPHTVTETSQSAFSVQMTRSGATSGDEYANPRFLISN